MAAHLVRQFATLGDDPCPLLVFAYAQGLPDKPELRVQASAGLHLIAAIVILAGAAHGSPLGENLQEFSRT